MQSSSPRCNVCLHKNNFLDPNSDVFMKIKRAQFGSFRSSLLYDGVYILLGRKLDYVWLRSHCLYRI